MLLHFATFGLIYFISFYFIFQCDVPEVDELDGIINEDESSDSEGFVQDGGGRKTSHSRIESRIPTVVSEVSTF